MPRSLIPLCLLLFACSTDLKPTDPPAIDTPSAPATAAPMEQVPVEDGTETTFWPDGTVRMKGMKKDGKREGIWTSYGPTGRVQSRKEFRKGQKEGPAVVFHDNGAIYYSGQYLHDKPTGEWRFHDETGELARTVQYDEQGEILSEEAH